MVPKLVEPVNAQFKKVEKYNEMEKPSAMNNYHQQHSNSSERKNQINELVPEYSIYLFNLSNEVVENELWRLFGPFGAIKNITIMKDLRTNHSKGFGFVTMKNLNEATNAIDILNGYPIRGRPLKVSFKGARNRTDEDDDIMGEPGAYQIYIFNLSSNTVENSIWKLFGQFGAVKNVSIVYDSKTNKSKGFAFVTMKKLDEAQKAIKTMNGFKLDGRNLMVSFKGQRPDESESDAIGGSDSGATGFDNDGPSGSGSVGGNASTNRDYQDRVQSIPIYVNYLPENVEDGTVWRLFSQFGAIKDVKIIRDSQTKRCSGYGFVNMKNLEEATLAINTLNGFEMNGKYLQVNFKGKRYL